MKDKSMIEELYDLLQEKMSSEPGPYEDEIMHSQKALIAMVNDPEKEAEIINYGIFYEKSGFYNGFRIATLLLAACIDKQSARILEMPFFSPKE